MYRLFVIDDQPIVREGVKSIVAPVDDLAICGEGDFSPVLLESLEGADPDLIIVDLLSRDGYRFELLAEVLERVPSTRILATSAHEDPAYAHRILAAGAHGFVSKRSDVERILIAIREVLDGKIHLPEEVEQSVLVRMLGTRGGTAAAVDPVKTLSRREMQVFQLIGHGRTTREITEELSIDEKTVHTHRFRIRQKLGLANAARLSSEATRWVHDYSHTTPGFSRERPHFDPSHNPLPNPPERILGNPTAKEPAPVEANLSIAKSPELKSPTPSPKCENVWNFPTQNN